MDPAINSRMFVFPSRAKFGDAAGRPPAHDLPPTPTETTSSGEKHKSLSLSWLSPHRRKDSGISISTRSSKSLRISSPTAAAAARPDRSSFGSRLSRESNRLSADSSKLAFFLSNDSVPVAGSPSSLRSPAFAPRRPDRPREGLFDDLLDAEKDFSGEMSKGIDVEEVDEKPVKGEADASADRSNFEDDNAPSAETPVTRRSRELLGLAFEAVGVALPDKRNRSSYASVGSDSSAAPSIASSPRKRRYHHKAFSESLVITNLVRSPSAASCASQKRKSALPAAAEAATGKQPRPSRWTLTESVADMFKSQKSPTLKGERKLRIETTWGNQSVDDQPSTPTEPKHKKNKVVQKLVTGYPILADLLGNQIPGEEASRLEPPRRPDGLPCASLGPNGPRRRAIPFEIVIPPPPTSVLFQHGRSPVELESPSPQQRPRAGPHETKEREGHVARDESQANASDDHTDDGQDRHEFGRGGAQVQDEDADWRAFGSFIPPPKNPARFSIRAPTMPQLPAIPEGFRSRADEKKFLKPEPWLKPSSTTHHRSRSLSQLGVETEECVYFRSTPFTLTNPGFRHGPITFQKSEIKGGTLLMESPVFDLAAFQSAIGGVGDLGEVFAPPEEARGVPDEDDESHLADEMTAWFEEFGFETHGELIAAEKPADRNLDRTSWDSACSMGTTLSMPLIIKTELADSAAEPQESLTTSSVHDLTVDYSTY